MTKGAESDSEIKVKHIREILKLTTKFINEIKHTGQVRISLNFRIIYTHISWVNWSRREYAMLLKELNKENNLYGLLTKCEVKMAGYWLSSFFACLWTETESRSINSQKKERGQYPAILTEQSWSIKDLLYPCFRGKFSCGTQRVVPGREI